MVSSLNSTEQARLVRERAQNCCEYCGLPQDSQEATFHLDHVQPRAEGGPTELGNLALACVTCSLKKGARTMVHDAESKEDVELFNPRRDRWEDHFCWSLDWHVQGLTPCGRATAEALGMNRPAIIVIRQLLTEAGRFPKKELRGRSDQQA